MERKTYRDDYPIDTSKGSRRLNNIGDVFYNKAKCLICGEVIESKHVHDYVTCSCGNLSVDGGSWYCKRIYETGTWEELSIFYTDSDPSNPVKDI